MNSKPERFTVRFSDLINYFGADAYVPEIHLIVDFDNKINQKQMQKALRLLLDAEPVLGCRLVEHWRKAYWERLSDQTLTKSNLLEIFSGELSEQEV